MKAIKSLFLVAALTAAGFAGTMDAQAATSHGGGGHSSGGHWSGGGHGGGGHYYGHGGHGHYYYPGWGFYAGIPLLWGAAYGWPYYYGASYAGYPYDYYPPAYPQAYPPANGAYPPSYPEGTMESAPTTQVPPNAAGAPTQGPAYVNFCASANAYYPKVTSCPEGWQFQPSH